MSYCREDVDWLERLRVHLRPLERLGRLDLWDDTRISVGDQWRVEIRKAMDTAAASVVLLSADFLASTFIASEELPRLLTLARTRGARVVPIFVQPCRLALHPELALLQGVNAPDFPLSKLPRVEAEEVFVRAAEQIEQILRRGDTRIHGDPGAPGGSAASRQLFDELRVATITMSIVRFLASHDGAAPTLTELTLQLDLRARGTAYLVLQRLLDAGWIVKVDREGRTAYVMSETGTDRLARLDRTAPSIPGAP